MATSVGEEFISSFHSLNGVTIGEKRKNLFHLLSKTQKSCDAINFSTVHPKTALEETFKVEALLYFRKTHDLVEVLKSENPILVAKVLKATWFINQAFRSITGNQLVKQIFPHLSYNTKLKLINKLALHLEDVQKADEFFEAIKESYGFYLASKLLPSCSEALIVKSIESNRIEITPKQLLIILKKYPLLTESIFEKLHRYETEEELAKKYQSIFMYLMKHDTALFLKLNEKYESSFCLGSRASIKYICTNKASFVEDPKKTFKLLKREVVGKYVKPNFEQFFVNVFPKSQNEFELTKEVYLKLLDHLGSNEEKQKILLATFRQIHGHELLDNPALMTSDIMQIISPEDREAWLESHARPNEITEDTWIGFMTIEKSVPLLKKMITLTSNVNDRAKIITNLVVTCKINNNLVALADLCEYVLAKHRNDHIKIREAFLHAIRLFDLKTLKNEHWKYIIGVIKLFMLNKENYFSTDFLEAYIYYCLGSNLPIEEGLKMWSQIDYGRYDICQKKTKYEKTCLLMFKDIIPQCHNKENELERRHLEYLRSLIRWNKRHPTDKISLFIDHNAIEAVKARLQRSDYPYPAHEVAAACIISDYDKAKEYNLLHLVTTCKPNEDAYLFFIKWLLINRPLVMLEHAEPLIRKLVQMYAPLTFFTSISRYYTHLEIPQTVAKVCLSIIDEENDCDRRKVAVFILSRVMQAKDYQDFASSYYPTELAIDVENKEEQIRYKLQQAIATGLRNIVPPDAALEAVLNFCKGDYLKLVQKSMYSVVQNVAENKLAAFFEVLMTRAVSVRKHAIFLSFKVLDKAKVYEVLTKFMGTEKNSSVRKNLFKGIFNFFLRNPDDYSWDLVKENIKAVDVNDHEAFNKLVKHKRIPLQYFEQYMLFVWDTLEKRPPSDKVDEEKCQILEAVTATNIKLLPEEFCRKVIEEHLFKSRELNGFQKAVHCFTSKYLICYALDSKQADTIKLVLGIVKDCMKTSLNSTSNFIHRKLMFNFTQEFCSHIMAKENLDKKTLSVFLSAWNDCLELHEAFDEYLLLQFTQIFLEFTDSKDSVQEIGEKLAKLCDSLQLLDVSIFCKRLEFFREHFLSEKSESDVKDNEVVLAESIVKTSSSLNCLSLALLLLPSDASMAPKLKLKCDLIVETIAKQADPMVQIRLCHYLNSRE